MLEPRGPLGSGRTGCTCTGPTRPSARSPTSPTSCREDRAEPSPPRRPGSGHDAGGAVVHRNPAHGIGAGDRFLRGLRGQAAGPHHGRPRRQGLLPARRPTRRPGWNWTDSSNSATPAPSTFAIINIRSPGSASNRRMSRLHPPGRRRHPVHPPGHRDRRGRCPDGHAGARQCGSPARSGAWGSTTSTLLPAHRRTGRRLRHRKHHL